MAYVAVSNELHRDIVNRIRGMCGAETQTLPNYEEVNKTIAASQEISELVRTKLWGDLRDLESRLLKHNKVTRVDLQVVYDMTHPREPNITVTRKVEVQLPGFAVPCFVIPQGYGNAYLELKVKPDDHPLFQQMVDIALIRAECSDRWSKVEEQVTGFVSKCKSLNEAIKLWPDVQRYVPKQFLDRVAKKAEKSASAASQGAEALKGIDVDMVNTSVVLARMAGATV